LVGALGFIQVEVDQAIFLKQSGDKITIIVVDVDYCEIAATTIELVVDLKTRLHEHVEITDLGELHWLF